METISNTNQEVKSDLKDTPEVLSSELQDLKKKVENPEVHTSFANMIWWLFTQAKEWVAKIGETGKETFTGIFKNAWDIAKYWANQVQEWAKTVVEEVKNTETAKKLTATAESATDKTVSTTQSLLGSALGMVGEAIKPVIDPEAAKLTAQSNLQQIEELLWFEKINNGTENHDEELLIWLYSSLKDSLLWKETPDWVAINTKNKNIEWQIKLYEETLKKADNINPIPNDLNKISSDAKVEANKEETKVIPLNPETGMKAAA